jgi:serine/threonine protein kinase
MPPASENPFEPAAPERASAVHPTAPVEPGGTVAGKYRVGRTIGFGGMGVICEATHLELGTKVAIKFVRLERAGDDRAVARFLTEARSAAQLKSQHTCRVVDCGRLESGSPYMVMEYLEGADLRSVVSGGGQLPIEDAVSFASQACEALAEAHSHHIVHRDIKPENLFLTQGPDGGALIKVLDFGVSKQMGRAQASRSLTEPTESIGSPYHMSPEQMIDPTRVDARTDIWSIGVVLYELLTGRLPFIGKSTPQICANVMMAQPTSPRELRSDIPEALAQIVLSCMEKDRGKRFPDVGALSRALGDFGGTSSGLSATRVERILDRAKEARSARDALSESSGGSVLDGDDDIAPRDIPGLPRRARTLGLAALAVLGVVMLGAFVYYGLGLSNRSAAGGAPSAGENADVTAQAGSISSSNPPPISSTKREPVSNQETRPASKTAVRKPKWAGSRQGQADPSARTFPDLPSEK